MRAFEIGVVLGSWRSATDGTTVPWVEIRDLAIRAEAIGFDTVWSPVKPAARNDRNASAICSAEPAIILPKMPVAPSPWSGATVTPAERPIVDGSRPTMAQAASKSVTRGPSSATSLPSSA
jgi:hypothetical protein